MSIIHDEVWKDIPDYEGYYQVSNMGRVRSLDRHYYDKNGIKYRKTGRILTIRQNPKGYSIVFLFKNDNRQCKTLHSIVMRTFVGDRPSPDSQINHIDCNKQNNCVSNLEYCTGKENVQHAVKNNLLRSSKGSANNLAKLNEDDVLVILERLMKNESTFSIGESYGVKRGAIRDIANGRTFTNVVRPDWFKNPLKPKNSLLDEQKEAARQMIKDGVRKIDIAAFLNVSVWAIGNLARSDKQRNNA